MYVAAGVCFLYMQKLYILYFSNSCISFPVGTNDINHWQLLVNFLMTGKTLATNGEEITKAMIGNDVLAIYWE